MTYNINAVHAMKELLESTNSEFKPFEETYTTEYGVVLGEFGLTVLSLIFREDEVDVLLKTGSEIKYKTKLKLDKLNTSLNKIENTENGTRTSDTLDKLLGTKDYTEVLTMTIKTHNEKLLATVNGENYDYTLQLLNDSYSLIAKSTTKNKRGRVFAGQLTEDNIKFNSDLSKFYNFLFENEEGYYIEEINNYIGKIFGN